ncbi:hypothetical protein HAX54_019446 [Datura stramonium]|uniref:Uncharacterized protein n=1 Tax=Datura stramonium TaxID=4076 RepID=A0ABS8UP70_DATST|nr:hypothetical protein [Datura stramonium]
MSTDLQFPQDLFEINSPKINSPHNSQRCSNIITSIKDDCKTPKSPPFLIPKILKCPAAPKKPRRVISSSCKRKLQFLEVVARQEVESFFRILDNDDGDGNGDDVGVSSNASKKDIKRSEIIEAVEQENHLI